MHSSSSGTAVNGTNSVSGVACSIASTEAPVTCAGARGTPTSRRAPAQASRPIQANPFTHQSQAEKVNMRVGSSKKEKEREEEDSQNEVIVGPAEGGRSRVIQGSLSLPAILAKGGSFVNHAILL